MTLPDEPSRLRSTRAILIGLAALTILAAVLTPEAIQSRGGRSSYATGPGGTRILHDLARRFGWQVERRIAPLDSMSRGREVQVVLSPEAYLGTVEIHRLLEHVRRGGGLVFSMDGGEQIADSLGVAEGTSGRLLEGFGDSLCPPARTLRERSALGVPPEVPKIVWRRPPPSSPVTLMSTAGKSGVPVAIGVTLGAGRVAIL